MLFIQIALLLVVAIGGICFVFLKGTGQGDKNVQSVSKIRGGEMADKNADMPTMAEPESFPFDPNTADSVTLRRLGLTGFQIQNIYRYRAKGGVYHRPEQFKKLYGLTVEQWHHLSPLIRIAERFQYLADTPEAYDPAFDGYQRKGHGAGSGDYHRDEVQLKADSVRYSQARETSAYSGGHRDTVLYPNKLRAGQTIDLNRADTTALKRIPGIGSYFARKIVQYRDKLGGFSSLSQLDELENIPVGIESYLTLNPSLVKKLRINRCTLRELNAHPYLSYYQARAISNHVRQFGPIHGFQDLSLYEEFTQQDFQRLAPYVDFSE